MEHKINSTFKHENVILRVVEDSTCNNCFFDYHGECMAQYENFNESCNSRMRKDKKNIKFVKVILSATPKQIQARRRAFMIMQLEGMVTNLENMRDIYVRAWFLKGMINTCIGAIRQLLYRLKDLTNKSSIPRTAKFNRRLLEIERCETWHELFNSN